MGYVSTVPSRTDLTGVRNGALSPLPCSLLPALLPSALLPAPRSLCPSTSLRTRPTRHMLIYHSQTFSSFFHFFIKDRLPGTPPLIIDPATGCMLFDHLRPMDHWRVILYSLECLISEKGPMPTLSALNEAALAYLFDVINCHFEMLDGGDDGALEERVAQIKAMRREAMWMQEESSADVEEMMREEMGEEETHKVFKEHVDDTVFWDDRDWEEMPMPPEMCVMMRIHKDYYSLEPSLSEARAAFPRFSDIEVKIRELSTFLNAELGLPAADTGYLPAGRLSKAAFLHLTAAARTRRIARHQRRQQVGVAVARPVAPVVRAAIAPVPAPAAPQTRRPGPSITASVPAPVARRATRSSASSSSSASLSSRSASAAKKCR